MTHERDVIEIEPWIVERRELVDPVGDVVEGHRIAATLAAPDPAVLHVPGCVAAPDEVRRERLHDDLPVGRAPVAAVDQDNDRMRAVAIARDIEIAAVLARRAVAVLLAVREEVEDYARGARHARNLRSRRCGGS